MSQNNNDTAGEKVMEPGLSSPAMRGGKAILYVLKNKYLVTGMLFLVWMVFFDPKDILSEIGRWNKFNELKASELQMTNRIKGTKAELGELKNNAQTIEKYARENYFMKKDNEDLFIFKSNKE